MADTSCKIMKCGEEKQEMYTLFQLKKLLISGYFKDSEESEILREYWNTTRREINH
ncbi:hypothetical protein L798_10465 [Zootermopsis nevadensis]|uniref:Uncharacterized protein n=1 Tax=Zootermopsis nevadensis TaxID=136037 RepID=A0A067QYT1_ZOONE|nr:hypothetical protein L798_10465 [Zootermopsis nevadensis]